MFTRVYRWLLNHVTDLKNVFETLGRIRREIGKLIPNPEDAARIENDLAQCMKTIEIPGTQAETLADDVKREAEKVGESIQDEAERQDDLAESRRETQVAKTVDSVEVQGGTVMVGDDVTDFDGRRMTIEQIRTTDGGMLVDCYWMDGTTRRPATFTPLEVSKASPVSGNPPDTLTGSAPAGGSTREYGSPVS